MAWQSSQDLIYALWVLGILRDHSVVAQMHDNIDDIVWTLRNGLYEK
jgi:hypothetical protein